jgi:hypothetical protein
MRDFYNLNFCEPVALTGHARQIIARTQTNFKFQFAPAENRLPSRSVDDSENKRFTI